MKKLILFISVLIFPFFVHASEDVINNFDMDIYVNSKGEAYVTETWDATAKMGSEFYHSYYNYGQSKFSDFSVTMDGTSYTFVENWNVDGSFESKKYKNGFNYIDDGIELCFGKTSMGRHKYVVKYKITDFISELSDAQMIYWTLLPYNNGGQFQNVNIKIYSDFKYSDKLDVWGFGIYDAPCYVKDGVIYMTSDGNRVNNDEYMTLLAKFPKGTFESGSILDNNFDYYLSMAQEGSTPSIHKQTSKKKFNIGTFITSIVNVVTTFSIFAFVGSRISKSSKNNSYNFGESGKKLGNVPNFRDIPCDKDIYYAFWLANTYDILKNKNDFLGAVLLKWIHDGNVTIEKVTSQKLFVKKEESVVTFVKKPENANRKELDLYDYMYEASGDGKLETNEFKKWCKKNYTKIFNWFDDCLNYERDELLEKSLLIKNEYEGGKLFKYKYYQYDITDKVREEAIKLQGLKQFFKEFSRINEKEPIEVKLWNEYLMYAQILGMADEVMKQFRKLYPEVLAEMESYNYDYDAFLFAHSISSEGVNAASAARSAAENYSSGGGGFSSGGGGGGSFGGGGFGGAGGR